MKNKFFTNFILCFCSIVVTIFFLELIIRLLGYGPWETIKTDLREPITYEYNEALQFGQYGIPSGSSSTSDPVFTERMRLNSNGNLGIGTVPSNAKLEVNGDAIISGTITSTNFSCSSDRRLKKNIRPINNALERLLKLRGVKYKWIQNDSMHFDERIHLGVIAQEVEEVLPDLVNGEDYDPVKKDAGKSIHTGGIVAQLVKAVQELSAKVEALENA